MTVALVGGIDRLERHYRRTATRRRVCIKVFNRKCPRLESRLKSVDAIVLFTGEVSHSTAASARRIARDSGLPIICSHTSSLTALEESIRRLKEQGGSAKT